MEALATCDRLSTAQSPHETLAPPDPRHSPPTPLRTPPNFRSPRRPEPPMSDHQLPAPSDTPAPSNRGGARPGAGAPSRPHAATTERFKRLFAISRQRRLPGRLRQPVQHGRRADLRLAPARARRMEGSRQPRQGAAPYHHARIPAVTVVRHENATADAAPPPPPADAPTPAPHLPQPDAPPAPDPVPPPAATTAPDADPAPDAEPPVPAPPATDPAAPTPARRTRRRPPPPPTRPRPRTTTNPTPCPAAKTPSRRTRTRG